MRLAHGEVLAVDRTRLLPADSHFNPSLGVANGAVWMVYRRVSRDPGASIVDWPRLLGACRIGDDLQPVADSNVDLSALIVDPPGARQWHADARLTARPDGLLMTYHDNHGLYSVPVPLGGPPSPLRPRPLVLVGRRQRRRERNWGVLDDGELKAVYTIDPHVVLRLSEHDALIEARPVHETRRALPWDARRWGEPHGGSPPVRVGETWFSFFQSNVTAAGSERRIYRVGLYGFAAEPPHAVTHMTRAPVLTATDFEPPYSFFHDSAVAYPSGALHADGRWLVSLGIHDRTLAFVGFDHERLLDACEPVTEN